LQIDKGDETDDEKVFQNILKHHNQLNKENIGGEKSW